MRKVAGERRVARKNSHSSRRWNDASETLDDQCQIGAPSCHPVIGARAHSYSIEAPRPVGSQDRGSGTPRTSDARHR